MSRLFVIFFQFLFVANLQAQLIHFRNYNRSEGLPQDFVYTIQSGADGYLWMGTGEGIARFDGTEFTNYLSQDSKLRFATSSFLSSDNSLWFGFFEGYVGKYNQKADSVSHIEIEGFTGKINGILESSTKQMYFLSQNGDVATYKDGNVHVYTSPDRSLIFYDATILCNDSILVASNKGVIQISPTNTIYTYKVLQPEVFNVIKTDEAGKLCWVGGANGISVFDLDTWEKKATVQIETSVNDLFLGNNNELWAGTNGSGVFRFSDAKKLSTSKNFTEENGLASNYIQCISTDREQNIWAGTTGAGVSIFTGDEFSLDNESITASGVLSVKSVGDSVIWIGTNNGLLKKQGNSTTEYLLGTPISSLKVDLSGNLWIGTLGKGISVLRKNSNVPQPFQVLQTNNLKYINDIEVDRNGTIWFASRLQGILVYNESTNYQKQYSTSNSIMHNNIHDLYCDVDNKIWIASSDPGLGYIQNEQFTKLDDKFAFNRFEINCIEGEDNGVIWLGTQGGGLFQMQNDSLFQYDTDDELLSNFIYMLGKSESGDLWIGSRNGLNIYNKEAKSFLEFSNERSEYASFNINSNAFSFDKDQVFVGVETGLITYSSQENTQADIQPLVKIESIEVDGSKKSIDSQLELPYGSYRMRINLKGVYFKNPDKLRYGYYLAGYEQDWNEISDLNSAYYPKLEDGNYQFFVEAITEDGVFSEPLSDLRIVIQKPFWKKWWFYVISISAIIILVYIVYQVRLRNLINANEKLESTVALKTRELSQEKQKLEEAYKKLLELENFKESLTSMIVHDLKNPLNLIITLSDNLPQIHEAGRQMLNMVLNILDVNRFEETKVGLRLQHVNLFMLVNQAINQIKLSFDQKHIKFYVNVDEGYEIDADADMIVRVLVNFLSNAVKYSSAGSIVTVDSEERENEVIAISIADTGYGIPAEELPFIFDKFRQAANRHETTIRSTGLGLTFCKLAIEAHGGNISVESEVGTGSKFTFTLTGRPVAGILQPLSNEEHVELNGDKEFCFNQNEKTILSSVVSSLQNLEVYDTSANLEILEQLPEQYNKIQEWKQEMIKAVYAFHEERYKVLLSLAE
ncbi:sensor histidine kinase [Chondrinema litorale]|uniref:sensor histidine kinase n=1 Tax=Chondrinema litorale TaxID=2994555 RepID=UPI0025448573|nr:sensor histidine kinase [Chondrinema litorale]UZR95640.1 ATP-binding protein [Chondrinema litorale]